MFVRAAPSSSSRALRCANVESVVAIDVVAGAVEGAAVADAAVSRVEAGVTDAEAASQITHIFLPSLSLTNGIPKHFDPGQMFAHIAHPCSIF